MGEPGCCITPNNDRLGEKDTKAGAHTARENSTLKQGVLPFPELLESPEISPACTVQMGKLRLRAEAT